MRGCEARVVISQQGSIVYGNAIFCTAFSIDDRGMVKMIDQEPIAGDLPVRRVKSEC